MGPLLLLCVPVAVSVHANNPNDHDTDNSEYSKGRVKYELQLCAPQSDTKSNLKRFVPAIQKLDENDIEKQCFTLVAGGYNRV